MAGKHDKGYESSEMGEEEWEYQQRQNQQTMNNNQKRISAVDSNEWFSSDESTINGIWKIHQYWASNDEYIIENTEGTRIRVPANITVTIAAADCRDTASEQAWAEIQCTEECMKEELKINTDSGEHPISNFTYVEWDKTMKEETAVQSDMGILEKWVEMEKSQPNIFKEANERIEKQAQETMDKLRKGEKVTWAAAYKDAGVKDPMEAGIEATIKGLTDMPTIRTVPIWNDRDVEGEPGRVPDSDDEGYGANMYLQDESAGNTTESINTTGAEYTVAGNLIIKQGDGSHTFSMNNDKPYTGVEIATPIVTSDSNPVGMIWENDKWTATPDDKTNPFSNKYPVQSKEVVPVYNSLEEISEDVSIARGKWDHDSADKELDEILKKLQNTISSGYYINTKPTE